VATIESYDFGRIVVDGTEHGRDVIILPTGDAVARYGELDPRHTAAALHLTC
jgi:hypothetical protein